MAVRNVNVVVLDVNPIITENCTCVLASQTTQAIDFTPDNITYYKCDVSKWEEVEAVSKKVAEEVSCIGQSFRSFHETIQFRLGILPCS
jgi:hypothetical protein